MALSPSTGWQWRKKLNISNSSADYQIKLRLYERAGTDDPTNSIIYCNNHCKDFPNDLRFGTTDNPSTATQLPQWIEREVSGTTTDYFAYNGRSKRVVSDINRPAAIHNSSTNKTYIAWQGGDDTCDPYICYYDHSTGKYSGIYKIAENPLSQDSHGAPTIMIDNAGYIHVWYGAHNSQIRHIKSQYPVTSSDFSLGAWGTPEDWGPNDATYPVAIKTDNGDIYVFYRRMLGYNNRPWYFKYSTDNGQTWSSEQKIIDTTDGDWGEEYVMGYEYQGNKIHLAWCEAMHLTGPPWDKRRNVYYCYLDLSNHHMYNIDGIDLGTYVNISEANSYCKVFDSTSSTADRQVNHTNLDLDSNGNPYILFQYDDGTNKYWKFAKRVTGSWVISTICSSDDIGRYDGRIKVYSSSDIDAYITNSSGIYKYHYDGTSWTSTQIYSDTQINGVTCVENATDELKIIFAQGIDYDTDAKLWAWGDNGILEKTTDAYIDIWVKLPSSAPDTIYLFAGNENANRYSDGDNTFLFFDDFEGTSIDISKWEDHSGGLFTVSNGILTVKNNSGDTTWRYLYHDLGAEYKIRALARARCVDDGRLAAHSFLITYSQLSSWDSSPPSSGTASEFYSNDKHARTFVTDNSDTRTIADFSPYTLNTWYRFFLKYPDSGYVYSDDYSTTHASFTATGTFYNLRHVYIETRTKSDQEYQETEWDFIAIMKYTDPEPVWSSFGAWESIAPPAVHKLIAQLSRFFIKHLRRRV